jgi:hypothetical protein
MCACRRKENNGRRVDVLRVSFMRMLPLTEQSAESEGVLRIGCTETFSERVTGKRSSGHSFQSRDVLITVELELQNIQ